MYLLLYMYNFFIHKKNKIKNKSKDNISDKIIIKNKLINSINDGNSLTDSQIKIVKNLSRDSLVELLLIYNDNLQSVLNIIMDLDTEEIIQTSK